MHYFYVLLLKNNQLYKGCTDNLERRIKEHQNGLVVSTKHRRPLKIIHYEGYLLKSDATRREKFCKTNDGRRLLKQQLSDLLKKLGLK